MSRRLRAGSTRSTWSRSRRRRIRPSRCNGEKTGARHHQDRGRDQRLARSATGQFRQPADHRVEFPDGPQRAAPRDRDRAHERHSRRRSGHRARSRARVRRQEHDRAQGRARDEGRSAGDFLQQHARRRRQLRRRADLESNREERFEVCGQHQLGCVPTRADQDVLPPLQRQLVDRDDDYGTVGPGGRVAAEFLVAAERRELR